MFPFAGSGHSKKRRKKTTTAPLSKKQKNTLLNANRFSALVNDAQHVSNGTSQQQNKDKQVLPPPIVVTNGSYDSVKVALNEKNITEFSMKIISIGLKLQLNTIKEHETFIKYLTEQKVEYYTHKAKNEKSFKAVMYGLPKTSICDLEDYFEALNIKPNAIFEMSTKSNDPNHAIYLFHFNKNEMSMADVKKVKIVNHMVVKWAPYSPKFRGPTQCRLCLMYGHGGENCHRKPICAFCASNSHATKDCNIFPANGASSSNNKGAILKCSNCSKRKLPSNHAANDPNCPARADYLSIRQNINQRNSSKQNAYVRNVPVQNIENIQNARTNQINLSMPKLPQHQFSYADCLKQPPAADDNNELFSMSELMNIFKSAVSQLKQCKTKIDQISVIAHLLEYAVK